MRHPHLHSIAHNVVNEGAVRDKDAFASPRLERRIRDAEEKRARKKAAKAGKVK